MSHPNNQKTAILITAALPLILRNMVGYIAALRLALLAAVSKSIKFKESGLDWFSHWPGYRKCLDLKRVGGVN
jgi:hypothetical protein